MFSQYYMSYSPMDTKTGTSVQPENVGARFGLALASDSGFLLL
jgi:hypothetical protein